jgi:pyruvate,water dikinase
MEIGGTMSRGSVVAPEYGIPAAVDVAGATQQLQTGQRVRGDGANGLVVPL